MRPARSPFREIWINRAVQDWPVVAEILRCYPGVPRYYGDEPEFMAAPFSGNPKTRLWLTSCKGAAVKTCPGTCSPYLCCRYQVINQTLNCPLDCTYCILQYYLNQSATVIAVDFDSLLDDVETLTHRNPRRFFRFGTGELGDSLALAASRLFARHAIPRFSQISNALLELKTKSTVIDDLLDAPHGGRTVLAWSLNPDSVVAGEERSAASVGARLAAARRAQEAGYLLAFHFDPMIDKPDIETRYHQLADRLYQALNPDRIAWISMGSLRFPPTLKDKIAARHPLTRIIYAELVRGRDGKLRYPRPLRVALYRSLYRRLTAISNPPFIYFCMESPEVWEEVTGAAPADNPELDFRFAVSLYQRFPGLMKEPPRLTDYQQL